MTARIDPRCDRGYTLVELMLVFAIVGILAAIGYAAYENTLARARIAKAQGDVDAISSAVSMYAAHHGAIPGSLGQVTTSSVNAEGVTVGTFLLKIPTPPMFWSMSYSYATGANGSYTISAEGDGTTVRRP